MTTLTILSEIYVILCIYKPDIHWLCSMMPLGKALTEGQGHIYWTLQYFCNFMIYDLDLQP